MELSPQLQAVYKQTADALKGRERRLFMAQVVKMLGPGGQRQAERELGWNRGTIRKAMRELDSGQLIEDRFSERGRKGVEEKLPNLLGDIQAILDGHEETDPIAKRIGLSTRQVRQMLIVEKGYRDEELPTQETVRLKIKGLGYQFRRRVMRNQPTNR
ncbi:MAG: hypothetical protein H6659_11940 [Ardenticatenaceae bacterium]|nr:hypothetical protein [Anaerolineales bacterium]MCB8984530.1 hypothetical protein [Ardenticatenaceae bacterium]MCB8986171.1 hypothetical protein [Ardenticatenaceae bacterium]